MYTVKLLTDTEFEKLPFDDVGNPEVCGCADPSTNTAYVRKSLTKGMRLLTIDHEVNELAQRFSPHEKNGIRYGWFKNLTSSLGLDNLADKARQFIDPIVPEKAKEIGTDIAKFGQQTVTHADSWAPQVAGAVLTAFGMPYLGIPLAGIGSGVHNYQETGDYGSAAISGVGGALTAYGAGSALSSGMNAFGAASTQNSMGMGTYTNPWIAGAKGVVGLPNPASVSSKAWTASTEASKSGIGKVVSSLFDLGKETLTSPAMNLGLMKMGGGMMALSALPIHTAVPQLGEITSKWLTADAVTKAGQKAKDIADVSFLSGVYNTSKETMGLISVLQGDIEKQYKQRAEDLDRMGLNANDQWMSSGERLEMLRRLEEEKSTESNRVEKELMYNDQQIWAQQKFNYIMDAIDADDAVKQDLLYADMAEVLTKYQVKENDIMQIRQLASQAGLFALASGMNLFG